MEQGMTIQTKLFTPGEPITEPGIYAIDDDNYHADALCESPSLSSTIARLLVQRSPRHGWYEHPRLNPVQEEKKVKTMDVGSAMHALLLGHGRDIEVLDYPTWATKASKADRDQARDLGRIPLLTHVYERAVKLVAAAHEQINGFEELAGLFDGALFEHAVVWQEFGGIWCRAKLDILKEFPDFIADVDFKSTDKIASPQTVGRQVFSMGYDVQKAFYRRGLRRMFPHKPIRTFVMAQEREGPGAITVVEPDEQVIALADKKAVVGMKLWAQCLSTGEWPAYPPVITTLQLPPWVERDWAELEEYHSAVAGGNWKYSLPEVDPNAEEDDEDEGEDGDEPVNYLAAG
jgi:hypothetical protein